MAPVEQPQPQPAPAPAVEPVPHPVGCANYRHIIEQYEWDTNVAAAVMQAESGCNPYAVGDTRVIGGIYAPSCGLMQIRTLAGRPACEQLHDPETNIAWAHKLYASGGWRHWTVCKKTVRCY